METIQLTPGMRRAMIQIGCGAYSEEDGWYDEEHERIDGRSIAALTRRGLVDQTLYRSHPLIWMLVPTDAGDALAEQLIAERRKRGGQRDARRRPRGLDSEGDRVYNHEQLE